MAANVCVQQLALHNYSHCDWSLLAGVIVFMTVMSCVLDTSTMSQRKCVCAKESKREYGVNLRPRSPIADCHTVFIPSLPLLELLLSDCRQELVKPFIQFPVS